MTHITTSKMNLLSVGVPGNGLNVIYMPEFTCIRYSMKGIVFPVDRYIELPAGKYRYLSTSTEITEQQAAEIVEKGHPDIPSMYIDYQCAEWACITAIDSLKSLLTANGIVGRCALIQIL